MTGELPKAERRNSIMSMLTDFGQSDRKKLQRKTSRMSLGSDLNGLREEDKRDSTGTAIRDPDTGLEADVEQGEHVPLTPEKTHNVSTGDRDLDNTYEDEEDNENEQPEDMGPIYVQPNTLLAELQQRKLQQRTRNRNAVTAYPNGMHSTLLELDAVAQIEKRKRQHQKVALAWETPNAHSGGQDGPTGEASDDDVPLGLLYGTKSRANGGTTRMPNSQRLRNVSDKQLGLMERRELEDNEPLSSRRNRLLGIDPSRVPQPQSGHQSLSQPQSINKSIEEDNEDDEVPLRERMRRLKQKKALDAAIADVDSTEKPFGDDVLSQFGVGLDQAAGAATPTKNSEPNSPGVQPENDQPQRPTTLRKSSTMATLLSANPTGAHTADRMVQKAPTAGTLLAEQSIRQQIDRKRLLEQNQRQSSYTMRQPSYNTQQQQQQQQQQYQQAYGHQMGTPVGYQPAMASPYGIQQNPMMGVYNPMMMNNNMAMGPAGMNGGYFAAMPNGYGGGTTPNMNMNMGYAMGYGAQGIPTGYGMGMGMQQQQEMPMQTNQRDQIDRWRSSVAK